MTKQETRARALLAAQSTEKLVEQFELTELMSDPNVPTVRGWIMDELEKRDPEAFDAWTDSDDIFNPDPVESGPRKWFTYHITIERRPDGRWNAAWTHAGRGYTDSFNGLKDAEEYFESWPIKDVRIRK